jgi:hypothetical protein
MGLTKSPDACIAATSITGIDVVSSDFEKPAVLKVVTGKQEPLKSGCSHILADMTGSTGFHGVFPAGKQQHTHNCIKLNPPGETTSLETHQELQQRNQRWKKHLLKTAKQLTSSFETHTVTRPDGEQETRTLVPEHPTASAISQLLALNTDATSGMMETYTPKRRSTVPGKDGTPHVVMRQEDVQSLAETLEDKLAEQHQVSAHDGLVFQFTSMSADTGEHAGTVELVVNKETITTPAVKATGSITATAAPAVEEQAHIRAIFAKDAGANRGFTIDSVAPTKTAYKNEDDVEAVINNDE